MTFVQETENIWRLRVPFENLTTSVFLLSTQEGPVLYDCATTDADVENVILPALYLPGHTTDCLGLHDLATDTLLTADALQLAGIGRFGCSLAVPGDYEKTIERIRRLAPRRILTGHAYVPYGDRAEGAAEIARYLDGCLETLHEIKAFVAECRHMDAEDIAQTFRAQHPRWPRLPKTSVKSLLEIMDS